MASDAHISLLKYNNYANRTTHPGDTFSDIMGTYNDLTHMYANEIARIDNPTLWNPNDGVTTVITTPLHMDFSTEPDYLLVWHSTNNSIESRWFVIETVRLQSGQYTCTLRRDVISEAWTELTSATCNIYRAIANKYDSIIYNSEPVSVNQILESEMEIKDKTGCPWIVFYSDTAIPTSSPEPDPEDYDITTPLSKSAYIEQWEKSYIYNGEMSINFCYEFSESGGSVIPDTNRHELRIAAGDAGSAPTPSHSSKLVGQGNFLPTVTNQSLVTERLKQEHILDDLLVTYYNTNVWLPTDPPTTQLGNSTTRYDFLNLDGKRLYSEADHKIYRISTRSLTPAYIVNLPGSNDSAFTPVFQQVLNKLVNDCTNLDPWNTKVRTTDQRSVAFAIRTLRSRMTLTDIPDDASITVNVPTMMKTVDSPYNIWCMPYGDITVNYNSTDYTTSGDLNLRVMKGILDAMTTGSLYDAQILPFCPLPDSVFDDDGIITLPSSTKYTSLTTIKDGSDICKGFIFSVPYATFERQILLDNPITVDDPKFLSMTKTWRLFAPNYGSQFEFSVPRNNGLTGFNVSCTYMPVQPYIRVAPIWGGLYGDQSFKRDPRGLICGGDYSLPRTQSAWVSYMENNKNYQDIFNRQLKSMDVQRGIQKQQEQWGMAAGVLGGITGGAMTGSAAGPWGALAGGIVGGVGAGITGAMDLKNSEKLFQENKSYATDMHALQLGNVQAMPNTLARTTAFNVDNRYFPIFATYKCTENEETAVAQFILNRSMTIGRIGQPYNYINNDWTWDDGAHVRHARGFIQGSIMWINTKHDTHFVDALNDEFSKGVYTK